MKILIDMNLSPRWVETLGEAGFETLHWSQVGDPRAADREILRWALANGCVLLTHDLDFGAILAATSALGPSVLQVRAGNVSPAHLGPLVCQALKEYSPHLESGALISIDEASRRARILPLRR